VTEASRDVCDYSYRTRADGKLIRRLSKHSPVVFEVHGVSDDVVVGTDSSSVGGGLNSDGMSVGTDSAVTAVSHLLSVGSHSSHVAEGLGVVASHVSVVSDGPDLFSVGVAFVGAGDMAGTAAGVPVVFGLVHSVDPDLVPVSGTVEGVSSLGDHAAGVPVGLEGSGLVVSGNVQRSESEFVVLHGLESVAPGKSHSVGGDSVGLDGGVVSSDPGSEHSVESVDESFVGSSSVLGVEVDVGSDSSDVDELQVLFHESCSGTLGLSEGFHAVEEGHVTELTVVVVVLLLGGDTVVPVLLSSSLASGDLAESVSLVALESLLAVLVGVTITLASAEVLAGDVDVLELSGSGVNTVIPSPSSLTAASGNLVATVSLVADEVSSAVLVGVTVTLASVAVFLGDVVAVDALGGDEG